jgi:hypothetical protein
MAAVHESPYEDRVDITGTVTMVRVDEPRLALVTAEGRRLETAFRPEDEATVVSALKERSRFRLRIQGRGWFTPEGQLEDIEQAERIDLEPAEATLNDDEAIWARIEERVRNLPPEVVAQLPEDGAEQLDHYIYGTRKRLP